MVGEISARHALSKEVIEGVSERTGGVPLFVEEVTRLLVERGEQGGVQAIPPTLQQSLAARLDRLGPAREVAQIGAVLGRDFAYLLLRDVAEADEPALQASLDRLADADLLFVEGAPPQANYRFKHALIQDAAYDSLLKSRRQALHRRAAEALREANAEPEAIAHHFTAGRPRRSRDRMVGQGGRPGAAPLGLPGGDRPSRQGDRDGGQGGRSVAIGSRDPGRSKSATEAANRLRQRGDVRRRASPPTETKAAFARAAELAATRTTLRSASRRTTVSGSAATCVANCDRRGSMAAAFLQRRRRTQAEFVRGRRRSSRLARHHLLVRGEFAEARTHCERALALATRPRRRSGDRFGQDPGIGRDGLPRADMWPLGEVERARELIEAANRRGAELRHAPSIGTHRAGDCTAAVRS